MSGSGTSEASRQTESTAAPSSSAPALSSQQKKRPRTGKNASQLSPGRVMEKAKTVAIKSSRIPLNAVINTKTNSYRIKREVDSGVFGFSYLARQEGGKKVMLRTEPLTESEDMRRFKKLKFELIILQCAAKEDHDANTSFNHLPRYVDSGCTAHFKFLVFKEVGDTLHDITRKRMKNSPFSPSSALRVSIQMLRGIVALHCLGFLHRFLRPQAYAIGAGSKIKTVYLFDCGLPFNFRDIQTQKVRRPRKLTRMIGSLKYMSRSSHRSVEQSRRDDLESWVYLSLEFFDLDILPWRGDRATASVLAKKERVLGGDFPEIFSVTSPLYRSILRYADRMRYNERPDYDYIMRLLYQIQKDRNIDFSVPYDWENADFKMPRAAETTEDVVSEGSDRRDPTPLVHCPLLETAVEYRAADRIRTTNPPPKQALPQRAKTSDAEYANMANLGLKSPKAPPMWHENKMPKSDRPKQQDSDVDDEAQQRSDNLSP